MAKFNDLLRDELKDWNRIIFVVAKIPRDVFREHGTSKFLMSLDEMVPKIELLGPTTNSTKFDTLCSSAPHISRDCMSLISLSYGALCLALSDPLHGANADILTKCLMDLSMGKGGVLAMLPTSPVLTSYQNEIKEKQRQRLSFAGLLGAESRHKDTKELKLWGRKKATEMRGSHIEISRKLASQVPSHLHSASKDPERLFYDDLRANAKPS